ncbi:MAG: hypothetical protein GY705_26530 [Bacteroidetes bacterium]|nr:hypothetical protein [Bacteroidota bacterium]
MTLQELFHFIAEHPFHVLFYFLLIPFAAFLASVLGKGEGHLHPWKYLNSTLIYLICVPGIFAITLDIYLLLFERQSIMNTDLFTQVLPIISMIATLLIIRKNVSLDHIPGFGKLSGLVAVIASALIIMWVLDRTRLIVFSYIPIAYVLCVFVVLLLVMGFGWSKMMGKSNTGKVDRTN